VQHKLVALAFLCIALVVVGGCTSLSGSGITNPVAPQEAAHSGVSGVNSLSDTGTKYSANSAPAANPAARVAQSGSDAGIADTKIIKTAYITLEVRDVKGSVETISELATGNGGYVSSTNIQSGYNNRLSGTIEIRVPAAVFENDNRVPPGAGTCWRR